MEGRHFEICYTTKDGRREFEEFRTRRAAEKRLEKLKASGGLDVEKDHAVMEFDEEGDLI